MSVTTTLDIVLAQAYLKELDALTRVRRAIVSNSTLESAWMYVASALDTRLRVLRDLLAREDPHVLRAAQTRLAETSDTPEPPAWSADWRGDTRVH